MSINNFIKSVAGTAVITGAGFAAFSANARHKRLYRHSLVPAMTAVAPFSSHVGAVGLVVSGGVAATGARKIGAVGALVSGVAFVSGLRTLKPSLMKGSPKSIGYGSFRVFSHNVLMTNSDEGKSIGQEIIETNPDVVALIEVNEAIIRGLGEALETYPYVWHERAIGHEDGALIASRFPMSEKVVLNGHGRPAMTTVLDVGSHKVRFVAVHTSAPINAEWAEEWVLQLYRLKHHFADVREDVVIAVGDFNATASHAPFIDMVRSNNFVDAVGSAPTWPRGWKIVPPMLGLDHVLFRGRIVLGRVFLGRGKGSDHAPVIADFTIK